MTVELSPKTVPTSGSIPTDAMDYDGFDITQGVELLASLDTAVAVLMVRNSFLMTFGKPTSTSST